MLKVVRRFRSRKEFGEDRLILVAATRLNSESGTCTGLVVVHEVFFVFFFVGSEIWGSERERILFAGVEGRKAESHLGNDDAAQCCSITSLVVASCLCARTCCCVIPSEHSVCYASCLFAFLQATHAAAAAAHHV
jgi:hypothetical protein